MKPLQNSYMRTRASVTRAPITCSAPYFGKFACLLGVRVLGSLRALMSASRSCIVNREKKSIIGYGPKVPSEKTSWDANAAVNDDHAFLHRGLGAGRIPSFPAGPAPRARGKFLNSAARSLES